MSPAPAACSSLRLQTLKRAGTLASCGYGFKQNVLELVGARLNYVDEGKGDPVVMVHGNPTWSFYYRHLINELRSTHRCIVPDHVGCGFSDAPDDEDYEYTLERRVADLDALITSLDLPEKISLVVHDWGGMIGTTWATRNPTRIAKLVVTNTAAFHLPRKKALPASLRLCRDSRLGEALVRGLNSFSGLAAHGWATESPLSRDVRACYTAPHDSWDRRISVARFVQDIPLDSGDRAYELVSETQAGLAALRDVPMLLCWGLRDFVFDGEFLAEWERRFPDAAVRRFERGGHYILEDAREQVISEAAGFLRG